MRPATARTAQRGGDRLEPVAELLDSGRVLLSPRADLGRVGRGARGGELQIRGRRGIVIERKKPARAKLQGCGKVLLARQPGPEDGRQGPLAGQRARLPAQGRRRSPGGEEAQRIPHWQCDVVVVAPIGKAYKWLLIN